MRVKERKTSNKREMEARDRLREGDGEGLTVQKERNERVESNITRVTKRIDRNIIKRMTIERVLCLSVYHVCRCVMFVVSVVLSTSVVLMS